MIPTAPSVSPSSGQTSPPAPLWKRFSLRRHEVRSQEPVTLSTLSHSETEASLEQQIQAREGELIVAIFRTLVVLIAIFAPRLLGLSGNYEMPEVWLAALAGLYNIVTGLSCLRPGRYGLRRSFVVVMDMMLITLWMRLSGQWELFPFYYLVVVVAAMWFRVLGGALAAAFCNFFFLFLWSRAAANPEIVPPTFTTSMALNSLLLFLVGFLVGYIAEIQERERERLLESQLLVANYQREIDLSSQMQPLLFNPTYSAENGSEPQIELGVAMQSARTLGGGDYADAIVLPDGSTLLCIADVAGKSVRAQARLPLLKYSLRALAPLHPEPGEMVQRLNETLAPDLSAELYIAFCCVRLDAENGVLSWCNAGHISPILVKAKKENESGDVKTIPLEVCGPPLGMFPEIEYSPREAKWKSGDHLLMYTDGLADALSYNGTEDGEAQIQKLAGRLSHEAHRPAREVAEDFIALYSAALDASETLPERLRLQLSALRPHAADTPSTPVVHRDDVTVIVARNPLS
jgi:serine phosphatase RsbU (regulator of sigma subunit)